MSVNGTLVEAKLYTFTLESKHLIFKKCPSYTHDGASAKFSINSQERGLQGVDHLARRELRLHQLADWVHQLVHQTHDDLSGGIILHDEVCGMAVLGAAWDHHVYRGRAVRMYCTVDQSGGAANRHYLT